jgi:hypothetical protein
MLQIFSLGSHTRDTCNRHVVFGPLSELKGVTRVSRQKNNATVILNEGLDDQGIVFRFPTEVRHCFVSQGFCSWPHTPPYSTGDKNEYNYTTSRYSVLRIGMSEFGIYLRVSDPCTYERRIRNLAHD